MQFIEPSYHAVVQHAYDYAAQHGQRVDSPHLVWAILHTHQWPEPVPPDAETFLQEVIATLRPDAHKSRETTLYAQMVLDRSHDVHGLLFHLFWSPWAQDQTFIHAWHHHGWAPPPSPPDHRPSTLQASSNVETAKAVGAFRRQQREMVQNRRRERPERIIEILRRGRAAGLEFWCTHAIQYASYSVVTGLQWDEASSLGLVPHVVRLEISTPVSNEKRRWTQKRYDSFTDGPVQLTEYQFIGEETFMLNPEDTLVAVTEGGQTLLLVATTPNV